MQTNKVRKKDFDFILDTYVGRGGPLQWRQFCLLLLQGAASTVPFYLHLFAAATPDHRCFVPGCDEEEDALSGAVREPWVDFAIPPGKEEGTFLARGTNYSQCRMFQRKDRLQLPDSCEAASFSHNDTYGCGGRFVFDRSRFEETLVTELGLVCQGGGRRHEKFLGSVIMVGLMLGCFVGGPLGDKLGRRSALLLAAAALAPLIVAGGFVRMYEVYAILRLFTYVCVSVMWINSHALLLELFGTRWRKAAYVANSVWYCLMNLLLPLIVYFERNWTYMHLWVGLVAAAAVPPLFFGLHESKRWLAVNGWMGRAEDGVRDMARSAGNYLSEADMEEIREILREMDEESKAHDERSLSFWDMFRGGLLVRSAVVLGVWVSSVLAYYAIALNATALAGDDLLNFALSSLADIPSSLYVLFTVDLVGRRASLFAPLALLSCCCYAMAAAPKGSPGLVLALFLVGKFSSSAAINVIWLYTGELYPTNLRAQAVAGCSLVSRVFGALAPFVGDLSAVWPPLPFLVLGVPASVSAATAFFLPESKGMSLPDTKILAGEADKLKGSRKGQGEREIVQ